MIDDVKAEAQFSVAISVALAIFIVFVYPLTFGPPAPQQKDSLLTHVLAFAFALCAPLVPALAVTAALLVSPPGDQPLTSERLALICTRLC